MTTKPLVAQRTTLADLTDLAVIPVWDPDGPSLAGVLGVSRAAAYAAIERGDVPVVRLGRRLVVPVAGLLALLGARQ